MKTTTPTLLVFAKAFTVFLAAIFLTISANATVYTVSDKATLQSKMSSAVPGDTIIVANGSYNWGQISFNNANGTSSSAWIVLQAQTNFGVVFTGSTYLQFSGKRILITGFKFASGNSAANDVISFKTSSTALASYCRLNNVIIDNYNSDSTGGVNGTAPDIDNKWVSVFGVYNRIDHCTFINKVNAGATLVVWYDNTNYPQQSTPTYHRIDSNYFKGRGYQGGNGGESMRIGVGANSRTYAYNIIESNLFEGMTQAEPEIISNKSCFNTYRYNTFKNASGGLTLRHGRYCSAYGNFFIVDDPTVTGAYGIRIIDKGHKVYNNYIEGVNGNSNSFSTPRAPISLYNGFYSVNDTTDPTHANTYFPGDSSIIAFNTIVNCKGGGGIVLGYTDAGANLYQPLGITVADNVVKMSSGQGVYIDPANNLLTYAAEGNVYNAPNGLGLSSSTGFTNTTLTFGTRTNRILPPPSLVQDAAVNTSNYTSLLSALDAHGQTRSAVYDIGSDEINGTGTVLYYPLDSNLVGAGKPVVVSQTITFPAIATKFYGNADFSPGATASSGSTVSYASSNSAVATIVNGLIQIVGVGTSNITASQAGDPTYSAAVNVAQTLTVSKANQTITFSSLPVKYIGDADFGPGATSSSGLAISYTSSNTAVATIVGNNIRVIGLGTSTITALQAGDGNYNAATNATQVLTVSKLVQTITFPAIATKVVGAADFSPGAISSAGLTITYSSSNTSVATIVGGNIRIVGAGSSIITASQAGDATYAAATATQVVPVTATAIFSTGDYRSAVTTGNWSSVASWQIRDAAGNWTTPSVIPTTLNNVFIQNGHTITNDITANCKNLNLCIGGNLPIGTNVVQVSGKMRAYTGTTLTINSDDVFYSSQVSATSGFTSTMASTTTGSIKIIGASRTVFAIGEWGASSFTSCALEFNMDNGATALLDASIKFRSVTVSSGSTLNAANNRVGADDGLSPNGGSVTIKTGGKIISSRSGTSNQVITALSTSKCGTVTIETGGTLELTGSIPTIDASAFINNGTVIYSLAGTQTLLQKGSDATSVNPINYYDIRLQGTSAKQLPAFNIAVANALYAEGAASLSNTTNAASKAILANGSTIVVSSSTAVPLVASTITFGTSATDLINITMNVSASNGAEIIAPSPGGIGTLTVASAVNYTLTDVRAVTDLVNNGRVILAPATSLTFTINGNITGSGTITGNTNASITFGGTSGTLNFTSGSQVARNLTTTNGSGILTMGTPVSLSGSLALTAGAIAVGANIITVKGDITGNGKFSGTGKILLTGSTIASSISADTISNLEINNGFVDTLKRSLVVTGTLTFTSGKIRTDGFSVMIASGGTVAGAAVSTGWVAGNLQKFISTSGTFNFEVGDTTAGKYTPASLVVSPTGFAPGALVVSTASPTNTYTNISTLSLNTASNKLNRYWSVDEPVGSSFAGTYTGSFTYVSGDLTGSAAAFRTAVYNGTSWNYIGAATPGTLKLTAPSGISPGTSDDLFFGDPTALTMSGITANNKPYDGITNATLNVSGASLNGVLNGNNVGFNAISSTGTFINALVGNGKAVTIPSVSLTGTDVNAYTITQPAGLTANITTAPLTIAGVTANNKSYDGLTTATLSGTASYAGLQNGETFSVSGTPVANFNTAAIGTGKPVTVTGYAAPSGNYSITQPTGLSANITTAPLTITGISANNKTYDGLTTATLSGTASYSGLQNGETFSVSGTPFANFNTAAIGTGKPVTVTGYAAPSGNYSITQPAGLTANITTAALTITGITANNKSYDGLTTATLSGTASYAGLQNGETFSVSGTPVANFNTAAIGTGKPVTITGYTAPSGNYSITQPTGLTANITTATLTITGITANNKTYDGTTVATLSGTALYSGLQNGETFSVSGTPVANFNTASVGTGKPVTITGYAAPSSNYSITQPTGLTANITTAPLTITSITANNKSYDGLTTATLSGTASYSGLQNGETFSVIGTPISNFNTATIGTAKPVTVSGYAAPSTNYSITQPTGLTANITTAALTITGITANNKSYDGLTTAALSGTASYSGLQNGETFSVSGTQVANFNTAAIGNAKPVTITGYAAPSGNYSITQPGGLTANITTAPLTITGITANNKTYDGTTAATLSGTASYSGLQNGEIFSVSGTPVANFNTAAIGTGKPVTVTGYAAPSGNYSVTQPTGLIANITTVTLTITGITANNKTYDGLITATLSGTALYSGLQNGETFSVSGTAVANFNTAAIGTGKPVTITGYTAPSGNYSVTQPTGLTANITTAALTITGITANNKSYDGLTTATLSGSALYSGLQNGETFSVSGTAVANFNTAAIGSGKPVTITGYAAPSGNYSITQPSLIADILGRPGYWGGSMGSWSVGSNWENAVVPSSGDDITILAGAPILSASTTVDDIAISSGATINLNSNTLIIAGVVSGTGTIKGTGSLTLLGTGNAGTLYFDQTTPGVTNSFSNFNLNRVTSGGVTLANAATFNGIFSLTNGIVSFAPSISQTITLNGTISSIAGFLKAGNSNASLAINGLGDAGTLFFDQTIPGTTNVFRDFTLNRTSSGKVILGNHVIFNGVTTLTNGSLQIGNNQTLTINGNFLNNSGSGTIGGGADETSTNLPNLVIAGTGVTNAIKFAAGYTEFGNVTFSCSAAIDATIGNGLRVNGTLQINGTSTTVATQDNVLIRSTIAATGRVGNLTGITNPVSGKVTVERYMPPLPTRRWRLLSIPTNTTQSINSSWQNGQSPGVMGANNVGTCITSSLPNAITMGFDAMTNGYSLLMHNQSTALWDGVSTNTTTTGIGTDRGYMIFLRGDRSATPANNISAPTTLSTTGPLKMGNYPVTPLSISANKNAAIGNPYASSIDLRNLLLGGNADRVFYLWDPRISGAYGLGAYQTLTWSGSDYIITPGGGSYGSGGSVMNTIQSGQAFLAHATSGSGSIQFNENCKVAGSINIARVTGLSSYLMTNLFATDTTGDQLADGTMVILDSSYGDDVNGSDALKVKNYGENFGMSKLGQTLAVELRKPINTGDTVYYKMANLKPGHTYKLIFETKDISRPGLDAILEDSYTNTSSAINLNGNTEYPFNISTDTASSSEDRFRLVFFQGQILQVSFASIKAWQQSNEDIIVQWQVANQQGIHHYEVEKSVDGRSFKKMAAITPNALNATYNWYDINAFSGDNYYRIKSIGQLAEVKISPVVKVKIQNQISCITIFPNPVKDRKLYMKLQDMPKGMYDVRLINQMGQVLMTGQFTHVGGSTIKQLLLPENASNSNLHLEITSPANGSIFLLQIIN